MSQHTNFGDVLAQTLPAIDRHLANMDVPLTQRPTKAAILFVEHFIEAIDEPDQGVTTPGDVGEFIAKRWFAIIYAEVEAWYRDRFGAAMDQDRPDRLFGVVSIVGTPFALQVPIARVRPGRSGHTVWVGFPDGVREGELPVDWIEGQPNLEHLSPKERREAEQGATETANVLRFINASLMSAKAVDEKLTGLMAGIMPRLDRAAQLLLELKPKMVQQAYWELQLACEHALKALQQQRTGAFQETHDLFVLYDDLKPPPAFERDLLKVVPPWKETGSLRYGQGDRDGRAECLKCYRAVLEIVAGAARSMSRAWFGNPEFEVQRPPWMLEADRRLRGTEPNST